MTEPRKRFASPLTRRSFLQRAGIGGAALIGGTLWPKIMAAGTPRPRSGRLSLNHVIISCQENRSFDHYFGYAAQVQAAGLGPIAS
jgi:phospholipase C